MTGVRYTVERFNAKIDRSQGVDACWPWTGSRLPKGYGKLGDRYAHRVAYETMVGPIPPGLSVLHSCDNPPCCNPKHLRVGTKVDNMRDMAMRSRTNTTKLTHDQVRAIRAAYATQRNYTGVGRAFGVSDVTVRCIVTGKRWWFVE